ncbi:TIGR01777 family oxidoreductase [Planomicrobium sp. CPCC 101110]|uniref:TIGR01777 family oxidoreductase n=1 Tax=Planomicrobium sp. CPCC 101110 TaxID=2599619 RepID=UPI0011B74E05|nr:TIGR01777 family oxidoreductase [Planomicrobium sp. CPCC 101110]TWT24110.1 TIGR01777 family protein [Planomicrobium sp. CPCC 101110]
MRIAITGGTGFVGKELTRLLHMQGWEIYILTRHPKQSSMGITYVEWLTDQAQPEKQLEGMDAFVNLAGASINAGRWSDKQKKEIHDSRISATKEVLRILNALERKPEALINASAVGIYPASESAAYTETSKNYGNDFLAKTVIDWERLADQAKALGIRVAYGRFGIILGKDDGALPLMALPYQLFGGGTVGSGKQWLSWIHVYDVARAIQFAIETKALEGPFNVTAPYPRRMKEFGKEIAKALGRPHWIPVPSAALKLALGEKSRLVLEGQQALPAVLQQHGFEFTFPHLQSALADLYK